MEARRERDPPGTANAGRGGCTIAENKKGGCTIAANKKANMDKRRYEIRLVGIIGIIGCLFCIGFCSGYCNCIKYFQESSWQSVRYYLELVLIIKNIVDLSIMRTGSTHWTKKKRFVYMVVALEVRPKSVCPVPQRQQDVFWTFFICTTQLEVENMSIQVWVRNILLGPTINCPKWFYLGNWYTSHDCLD